MESKNKFGVIWDQTGVLYKYGRNNVEKTFRRILKKHSIDIAEKMFSEKYRGTSLVNQIRMWKEDFNIDVPISPEQFSKEAAKEEYSMIDPSKEYDQHLIKLLEELKDHQIPMAVVTSSTKERAENILKILNLKKYFDFIVSAEDAKNEPSAEAFSIAVKKLGLSPRDCIVIEDAASGIQAAKKAGCKTMGYSIYSNEQYKSLKKINPDLLIKDFKELSYDTLRKLVEEK